MVVFVLFMSFLLQWTIFTFCIFTNIFENVDIYGNLDMDARFPNNNDDVFTMRSDSRNILQWNKNNIKGMKRTTEDYYNTWVWMSDTQNLVDCNFDLPAIQSGFALALFVDASISAMKKSFRGSIKTPIPESETPRTWKEKTWK